MIRRWILMAVVLALLAGTVLSLPTFWDRPVVGETAGQKARHWLACVFTATAALTGTGLTPHDIGDDFKPAGQALLLAYIQAGGLAVLIAGGIVGWRLRRALGWEPPGTAPAARGLAGPVALTCLIALAIEAAGAAALYRSGNPAIAESPRPLFAAVFQAVSGFCNSGLLLARDSLIGQRGHWTPYGVVLPLMVLGSLGGPVLIELLGRFRRGRPALSRDTRATLAGSALLLVGGAAAILFVESTPRWQLRNPRADTPGRLMVPATQDAQEAIVFSADDSSSADRQRMRTLPPGERAAAALFHSQASRSGGMRVARLDEQSLAPASRFAMTALMLAGGGVGGTAGGLRIVVVVLLLGCLRRPVGPATAAHTPDRRADGMVLPAGVAVGMALLIGFVTAVLVYRDSATVEASVFEAVSACCNVGLSTGLTRRLSIEGQVAVILGMILGRVLPLALLARPAAAPGREPGEVTSA